MKKILLSVLIGVFGLVLGLVGNKLFEKNKVGGRITTSEVTLFTTSTNSNYSSVTPTNVNSFNHIEVTVAATASSGTLKFACSSSDTAPVFSSTQSATNRWDYIEVVDKEDGAAIDGDTGITLSDTTDVRQFEINDNFSTWCTALLTGNTTPSGYGTTTVFFKSANNQ